MKFFSTSLDISLVYGLVLFLSCLFVFSVFEIYFDKRRNLWNIPGPFPLPLFGNALLFAKPHEYFMPTCSTLIKKYGKVARIHLGPRPNVIIASPEGFEKVLSSNKQITKGKDYKFLMPWLGTGLLTSTGNKWHTRRKMLTPAFHFRILEDFLEVMNFHSAKLCNIFETLSNGKEFDVFPLVTHCALDIICETAMGKSINAQEDSDSEYVRAIYEASDIVFRRQRSPWLWDDRLFVLTPGGFKWRNILSTLHGFTNKVIAEKKQEYKTKKKATSINDDVGLKKRLAFLDLLIEASDDGDVLSDEDIREEVDTFMFEGHDTTATSMSFFLFLMATHPEIQRKCQEELQSIFGDDDRLATSQDLASMRYIELCLKEGLRLYQSVPIISRTLGEDLVVGGNLIPAGTNAIMLPFLIHRDPEIFPDPDSFQPERFLQENISKRNPYSYVPFSAGPRNCIGQKFAMMEEKVLVSSVLRKYNLNSSVKASEIPLLAEVILRPKNGIHISLEKRK